MMLNDDNHICLDDNDGISHGQHVPEDFAYTEHALNSPLDCEAHIFQHCIYSGTLEWAKLLNRSNTFFTAKCTPIMSASV